ncbi:MAG: DciA family protein [Nocardioides sp.]|uniref:DUF721 domain-containing protein n=1 Tax=Nocardioides sp. TaxID=35761 RepID=UPI0039E632FE
MSEENPSEGESPADTGDPQAQPEPERPADGLDLARALTRSVSKSPAPRTRSGQRRTAGQAGEIRSARGRVSGARPDDRDPQTLEAMVERIVADHGWDLNLRVHGVFGRWPELVGQEIAEHSHPETFADGKLVIRAGSTAWATQLTLLAPTLVRRLNEELGHGTVTLIEVRGPHGPSWKKGPRSVRGGRGPRDTYG